MAEYPVFQIDAFAPRALMGNPACVMPMDSYPEDEILQAIAAENNVAETAFIVPVEGNRWKLRWFTPTVEVPLCGHATMASAHALFDHMNFDGVEIIFETRKSGELRVQRTDTGYLMNFPAPAIAPTEVTDDIVEALGARPIAAWAGSFFAAQFETPEDVLALEPDLKKLSAISGEGRWERGNFGCFAHGGDDDMDVTSRFFAPGSGIDEDPATGSWHCMLTAVMAEQTGKSTFRCYQAYPGRGGRIDTRLDGDRVLLAGQAVTVIEGIFRL